MQPTSMSELSKRPVQHPKVMERLFTRLLAFYGTKFSDAFAGLSMETVRDVWAEELSGYSMDELNRGVNACRSLKWPPTLPEFLMLCRPPLNHELAYHEAMRNMVLREQGVDTPWSHPAVYHAAAEVTAFELRRLPWERIKARWCATLDRLVHQRDLSPVPPAPKQLAAPEGRAPTAEEAARLAEVKGLFTKKETKDTHASDPAV